MTKNPFAYVCAPGRANNTSDMNKLREFCRQLYEAEYTPICPALQFPQFMNFRIPKERKNATEMAQSLLRRCRVVVVCGGAITDEMLCDIMLARRLHITTTTLDGILAIHSHKLPPPGKSEVTQ